MAKQSEQASVLAFERKLANSDALMYAGDWNQREVSENWRPIEVQEKAVRGTISNRQKAAIEKDDAKLNAEIDKPNLQRVDVAALPFDCDTLKVSFTLRVLGDLAIPSTCNNPIYQEKLSSTINQYIEEHAFTELGARYAENLANGRFLWRNRVGAEEVEVVVSAGDGKRWTFNSFDFSLRSFSDNEKMNLSELSSVVKEALRATDGHTLLKVDAFVKLGEGQEVFPSQELILDHSKSKNSKGEKSKVLYSVGNVAAMHSQKIGNAIRTIDTWHAGADEVGPIAVEPYGSVTNRGKAYRTPNAKLDFYTLLDNWIGKDKVPSVEQQHYVMATLIRGGVFGKAD